MSPGDVTQTADLLSKLKPGFLPLPIFNQVARLIALPIVEIVPLRTNARGEAEVLLLERPKDDPYFPGKLHTPGVVILSTDQPHSFADAFARILDGELAGTRASKPMFVDHALHHSARGMECAYIHWVEVQGEPAVGTFYPASNLPSSVIPSQHDFIAAAVNSYNAFRKQSSS